MVVYSISDLEQLSGVKAHTLRIWEKRYSIIKPKRTETNIRYYLDKDLQLVLNIALLNRNGYKISKIAQMDSGQIKSIVREISDISPSHEDQLDSLILSILELDQCKFGKILDHNIKEKGLETTMNEVLYPLLDKLNMMWITNSIKGMHENFVTNIIKCKTMVATENLPSPKKSESPSFIIFLPEKEPHELSLLYLHYLLKKNGAHVINLGMDVSFVDVIEAQHTCDANFLFLIINESFSDSPLQPYIDELSKNVKDCQVLLSGYQVISQNIKCPPNVSILKNIGDVKNYMGLVTS